VKGLLREGQKVSVAPLALRDVAPFRSMSSGRSGLDRVSPYPMSSLNPKKNSAVHRLPDCTVTEQRFSNISMSWAGVTTRDQFRKSGASKSLRTG
jgi:hypothetical protein